MYNRAGTGGKPGDTPAATSLTCSLVLCHRAPGLAHSPQLGSSCVPPGKAAQPGVPWELHPSVQQSPWTLRQLQMHDLKTRVLFTEVNELHSQHKPLWEFWYYLNLMHFPIPTFSELDMSLVVIFRFTQYSVWGRSHAPDPLKHRQGFYTGFTFFKIFFTIMKKNLFLQYRLRFFCTVLPQEVNVIKFSSHKSAERIGPLCNLWESLHNDVKLECFSETLKTQYSYHHTLVPPVWKWWLNSTWLPFIIILY